MKFILFLLVCSNLAIAEVEPMLIGGSPAAKGDFPEVVYIRSGNARCSATVIGPQVIMTAGHCVADQGSISNVDFIVDQIVFQAKCEQSPGYHATSDGDDYALCKTDKVIEVKYASVAKAGPKVGEQVTLSGYGCINPGGGAGNDGILRVGAAPVTRLPASGFSWFVAKGNSALCFGDSGGPAFMKLSAPAKEPHVVIGVNSQGNIQDTSYLSALWIDAAQKFFKDFSSRNRVEICGVNKECGKQSSEPKPACARLKRKLDKAEAEFKQAEAKYNQCQK